MCDNPGCKPKLVGAIVNACGKKNWDIDLGESVAEALVNDPALVESLADLFNLKDYADEVSKLKLSGKVSFGKKRTDKLLAELEVAKSKPWHITLHALGCPGLGEPECKSIAAKYSLTQLLNRSSVDEFVADITKIKGMGKTTAIALDKWLWDSEEWLTQLEDAGLNTEAEGDSVQVDGPLTGKTLCITGTHSVPRAVLEKLITDHGGTLTNSVTKKLGYLVAGEAAGSKLDKALKSGVTILDEQGLRDLCSM